MTWFRLMCLVAIAFHLAGSGTAADHAAASTADSGSAQKLPPVLQSSEPPDSGQVVLPGPPPAAPKKTTVAIGDEDLVPGHAPVASLARSPTGSRARPGQAVSAPRKRK